MKKTLIDKYLNGETSLTEEQELIRRLQATPNDLLTSEERAILTMLSYNKGINSTKPASTEEDIFEDDLTEEYDRIVNSRKRRMWWRRCAKIAAAVALLAIIVGAVGLFRYARTDENLVVAYVYGTETTDEELVMSMMKNTMSEVLSCSTTDEKLYELFNPE